MRRNRMLRYVCMVMAVLLLGLCVPVSAEEQSCVYSSVLMEAETGMVLGGTESDTPVPIGSLTKLMTVLVVARAVAEGRLSPDTLVSTPAAAQEQLGAVIWLLAGEQMTVTDLLKGVIIGNANDAAVSLAAACAGSETQFVLEMQAEAFSLELRQTRFADCTGNSSDNRSTAKEVALICRALLEYDWLTPIFTTWRTFLRGEATELVSENRLTRTYDGILGMKAGHGTASGYTAAIAAERDGMRCIAVILGCEDTDERFTYAKNLLAHGFASYVVTTPDFSTEFLRPIPVRHGIADAVTLEASELSGIALPQGERISCVTVLPKFLEAPVARGKAVGTVAFYAGDTYLYEASLCAAESVERRRLWEALAGLLDNLFK